MGVTLVFQNFPEKRYGELCDRCVKFEILCCSCKLFVMGHNFHELSLIPFSCHYNQCLHWVPHRQCRHLVLLVRQDPICCPVSVKKSFINVHCTCKVYKNLNVVFWFYKESLAWRNLNFRVLQFPHLCTLYLVQKLIILPLIAPNLTRKGN